MRRGRETVMGLRRGMVMEELVVKARRSNNLSLMNYSCCEGDLVCGSNNCKKFGAYYHERDDCCEDPDKIEEVRVRDPNPNIPVECPPGQRCCGRNFGSRGCCSIEEPCGEG